MKAAILRSKAIRFSFHYLLPALAALLCPDTARFLSGGFHHLVKYVMRDGRLLMPVSVLVHHTLADGISQRFTA